MITTEKQVSEALEFLHTSAEALGLAKTRAVRAEHMLKHTEALLFKGSSASSAEARKADARTDKKYLDASLEDAFAAGELAKLYAQREAAAMRIEAWRSENANLRSVKL